MKCDGDVAVAIVTQIKGLTTHNAAGQTNFLAISTNRPFSFTLCVWFMFSFQRPHHNQNYFVTIKCRGRLRDVGRDFANARVPEISAQPRPSIFIPHVEPHDAKKKTAHENLFHHFAAMLAAFAKAFRWQRNIISSRDVGCWLLTPQIIITRPTSLNLPQTPNQKKNTHTQSEQSERKAQPKVTTQQKKSTQIHFTFKSIYASH